MQAAALAALTGPQDCIPMFKAAYERRRDLVVAGIAQIPGLTLAPPEGAFYVYPSLAGLIGRKTAKGATIGNDEDFARELLQEFRTNSKGLVTFHFFDYNSIKDQKKREDFQMELVKKGLRPTNLEVKSENGYTEKLVFPGAVIKANGREIPVQILENQFSVGAQGSLNNSINFLEYKLANSIQKITKDHPTKIAFLQGHGELGIEPLQEFLKALSEQNFILDKVELDKDKLLNNNIDKIGRASCRERVSSPV